VDTTIKQRLDAGETLFGAFLALGSPLAAEALARTGFDWLLIDLEHGGGHEATVLPQLLAARPAHVLARVESPERARAGRLLDLGVEGLMCPRIDSAGQAREWAAALRYPPAGTRGVATYTRAAGFGTRELPEAPLGVAQIESRDAVAEAEAIAAVDGIDVLFVGPSDLTFALGRFRDYDAPEYRAAVTRVVAAAAHAGKPAGIFLGSPQHAAQAITDGFRLIALGSDASHLMAGAHSAIACRI
jgi:2-keto-3-deoxy-L-rhamnonate aldolase RhmA